MYIRLRIGQSWTIAYTNEHEELANACRKNKMKFYFITMHLHVA